MPLEPEPYMMTWMPSIWKPRPVGILDWFIMNVIVVQEYEVGYVRLAQSIEYIETPIFI